MRARKLNDDERDALNAEKARIEAEKVAAAQALAAETKGLDQATSEALVSEAHKICPYSNAIRGNIEVALSTEALAAKAA